MSDLLDSTIKKKTVQDGFTNIQDRIRHLLIDGLIVMIISALIRTLVEITHLLTQEEIRMVGATAITLSVYILYYTTLEFYFGFTIGKLLNKTRVINLDESKPRFVQIVIRTLTRPIPIGFVTIATPYKAALNDLFSKTRTIRIKKKKFVEVNEV